MYDIPVGTIKSPLKLIENIPWINYQFAGASTDNLPPGVLYKVKASYKYQAEDVDELNFEVGEIIQVVEYDDTEDQVWKIYFFSF